METQAAEAAMSSDFSIKPAAPALATPVAQFTGAAADDAVASELPARQSVSAADSSARIRNDPQRATSDTSKHVMLDRDPGTIVYQVVDNRTSLVMKQFPDQQFLRRRAYARALEQAREDAVALKVDRRI